MDDKTSMMVAAVQMVSTPEPQENFVTAERLVRQAAAQGAQVVLLPEYWSIMGWRDTDKVEHAEPDGDGPIQQFLARLARELRIWLVGGTLPLQSPESGKVMNTVLVFAPDGSRLARYDKVHLFSFQRGTESYDEARTIVPGTDFTTFELSVGKVGLSVCYDLRFPELYRRMGDCALIMVPAAFTYTTGRAHWEMLLRARAVENQCYVLAAAQGGEHRNGRRTFGHSMLIDPWGEVLSCLDEGEGFVQGVVSRERIEEVRTSLPALRHRRW